METIAIISIVASLGTLLTVFSKTIKKSTCCACLNFETRTPPPSVQYIPPNPTPQPSPQILKREIMKECEV